MSDNGSERVTLELLRKLRQWEVTLPVYSRRAGKPMTVLVRKLTRPDYLALLPPSIPGSETWTDAERPAKTKAYIDGLTPEARAEMDAAWGGVGLKVCTVACIDPPFTPEIIEAFEADIDAIAAEILRGSGLA